MVDDEYYLYGTENECKAIAFVLNIKKYKVLDKISNYNRKHKLIICCDINKVKGKLKKYKIKHKKEYLKLNDIYKILNKDIAKEIEWVNYRTLFNRRNLVNIFNIIRPKTNNIKIINKIPNVFLKNSEMYIKTMNSKSKEINCNSLERTCNIDYHGYMWGCCPSWIEIPFGNLLKNKNSYNSFRANIIKLSSLNKTYCFCDLNKCKYGYVKDKNTKKTKITRLNDYPEELIVAVDRACNLKCLSCRKCYNTKTSDKAELISEKLIDTGWLKKSKVILAGQGEVFLSPVYKNLLFNEIKNTDISLVTNGTLFNKKNWEEVHKRYKNISISISIDAATKETYKKLRCGNFDVLSKNLKMLGEHRKNNEIKYFELNFVVQRDNYKEIEDFIKMAEEIHADKVNLTKLNDWNTYSKEDYLDKRMVIDNHLEKELYDILKRVENNKIANIECFKTYIEESDKIYE